MPFALHVTWTCYGTWKPGDPRGHVSNTLHPTNGTTPRRNTPKTPYARGDKYTHDRATALQAGPTVWLSQEQAVVVAKSLLEAGAERGWTIVRASVMDNHVHVVVMDCPNDGPAVRRILKGVSQAALSRHAGKPQRWWTQGGSNRYKNDDLAIRTMIRYVERQKGQLATIVDGKLV